VNVQHRISSRVVIPLVATALIVAACGTEAGARPTGDLPLVMATTTIWAAVVSGVACDVDVEIRTISPAGLDPHDVELSLAQRVAMEQANLIVENGLGLEAGMLSALSSLNGSTPVFTVADYVTVRESAIGTVDPHIWLDPVAVSGMLPRLGLELEQALDLPPGALADCVADYQARLLDLDNTIQETLAPLSPAQRQLVTNHDLLGYFAERYQVEVAGTVLSGTSSLAGAKPRQLDDLASTMTDLGIRTIFINEGERSPDAAAVARAVGGTDLVALQVAWIDKTTPSYVALMRTLGVSIAAGVSDE
jgi:zinc/manganese transport system substrate-binding protein